MSKKMEEVREAGVRVVSEDFLTDIKSSGKALQELVSQNAISPWGAEVKAEAVAPSVASKSGGLATKSTGRVKEEEGKGIFNAVVAFVDPRTGRCDVSFINYTIITGGSKAKKVKLTVKGGAAVDPDSGTSEFPVFSESFFFFLSF